MKSVRLWLLTIAAVLSTTSLASTQQIPSDTVFPVMLNGTLDSRHSAAGKAISARLMQNVGLPDGRVIPAGSRVVGQLVAVEQSRGNSPSRLAMRFDAIVQDGHRLPIVTHLRALASPREVFEAQMPTNAIDDYGTSPSDWNTIQVGGAGVYRGNGEVTEDSRTVGRTTDYGAVTARLIASADRRCNSTDRAESLWVFSPSACGLYGYDGMTIARSGKSSPAGEIELQSARDIRILGGSGLLLRVNSGTE